MLSALQIATQGLRPPVTRLIALQGFGPSNAAPGGGGYSDGASSARRRYVVRRGKTLMSFAWREDAEDAAREIAAELAARQLQKPARKKPGAAPVQAVINAGPLQLPDALDLSAAHALAAEQGLSEAFGRAMVAGEYATLVSLYLCALQLTEDDDIEALLLLL